MGLCRLFGLPKSTYYHNLKPKKINASRVKMIAMIKQIFTETRGAAGARTLSDIATARLNRPVSRYIAGRIMKAEGLVCRQPGKHTYKHREKPHAVHKNLLKQNFIPEFPNEIWSGDVTYIKTAEGWHYLAVVLDLYSRNVVGFSLSDSPDSELTKKALHNAYESRKRPQGVIFHSDQGSHYSSKTFAESIKDCKMTASMSRRGNCYDNSPTERFFRSLKTEWIPKQGYATRAQAEADILQYITGYYRKIRPHQFNNRLTPEKKEQLFFENAA